MRLDVYRTCSRREKREVLEVFWRDRAHSSPRVGVAARQYGPYAVASLAVVALEVAVLSAAAFSHSALAGSLVTLSDAGVVASLALAFRRQRVLARRPLT